MTSSLSFDRRLELVAERSAALRSSVAGALDVPVPGCPEWTGRDLVAHLGEVHRSWAVVVAAGPGAEPPDDEDVPERTPAGDLFDWSERSTELLLTALAAAGPNRRVWTWWGEPADAGAVARHQVQEATVHAWDAEDALGRAGALPTEPAADGVDEFLSTGVPMLAGWQEPVTAAVVVDDIPGGAWRVSLDPAGARLERAHPGGSHGAADVVLRGSASDLVLFFYRRRGVETLDVTGDSALAEWFAGSFPTD
jgi:uncharacterized protein (TIGR03083 family)